LNAQQNIVNGDFEAAMSGAGFVYTYQTIGWNFLINGGPEVAAFEGAQAAKLVTTADAGLNGALGWGNDTISGIAQQVYTGAFTNPEFVTVDFAYKFTSVGGDKGLIQVAINDTMAAGSADDVNLFFGVMEFTADVAAWTPAQLLMTASGSTGTANSMSIIAVYSQAGVFDANTPNAGTTLWLDGFVLGATALGLDEEAALTAKVYPNPTSTVLNVNTSSAVTTVSILSLDGKVLSTTNMNGTSTSVDVSTLTSGVYFYEIVAEDGNVIRDTFVKK
ncbi:MAG TPA: T9SS type A sorting domain-containing protein, partial [Crocinitomicaceae bacterium]|nr:T9SS type A sorting domain-containing protein [Crocinitomicaceae bacterium]